MFLELMVDSQTDETSEPDPDDRWDRASTSTNWFVNGVRIREKDSGEHCLKADFDVKAGDIVHCLYAIYSSGDSFGHDAGYSLEVLSFHKDAALAKKNLDAVAGARSSHMMEIETDSGGKFERYCPWDGYFESLDSIEVGSYIVQMDKP